MKLTRAIELLNTAKEGFPIKDAPEDWEEYYKAVELLIEAGKRVRDSQEKGRNLDYQLLPGETEEEDGVEWLP